MTRRRRSARQPVPGPLAWNRLAWDAWALGLEASQVVGLRGARIAAGGPAGEAECRRMLQEKLDAALAWQALAMAGALGATAPDVAAATLRHYRRKVRANRRRLLA